MSQIIRFKDTEKLSKKELQELGTKHSKLLLDEGFVDATIATVQVRKCVEYLNAYLKGLDSSTREQLTQDPTAWENVMGASLSLGSTGDRLSYQSDQKYGIMEIRLKERKSLLDLAYKSMDDIFDSDGDLVEKVKIKTHSKETLKVIL